MFTLSSHSVAVSCKKARVSAADADMCVTEAVSRLESAIKANEDLLALVDALQSQIKGKRLAQYRFV
ncbi:hypothetical protein BS78_06G049900 [Paspalum vaginatum]|nr:hypothetical protein BS78_06G049900 [Paspalum vaginatum]